MAEASITIKGAKELQAILSQFPKAIEKRIVNNALSKAGGRLRTYFRRAAPKGDGTLRKSIGVKRDRKTGRVSVGLQSRLYYKTLEHGRKPYKRRWRKGKGSKFSVGGSPAMRKFFEQTWALKQGEISQLLLDECVKAISVEAGRAYARSRAAR